jgi:hypothetical protein
VCVLQQDDPWTVRVLPKVYFGVHPLGLDGVGPDDPDIVVLHHFLGSWKVRGGWSGGLGIGRLLRRMAGFFTRSAAPDPCVLGMFSSALNKLVKTTGCLAYSTFTTMQSVTSRHHGS